MLMKSSFTNLGDIIKKGELLVGKLIGNYPKQYYAYKHWACIGDVWLQMMMNFAHVPSEIAGFNELELEEQKMVKAAWADVDSRERKSPMQESSGGNDTDKESSKEEETADEGTSETSLDGGSYAPYTMKSLLSPPRNCKRKQKAIERHASPSPAESESILDNQIDFADSDEERDWRRVTEFYMEYPDPLPPVIKWNAYHWAQFHASGVRVLKVLASYIDNVVFPVRALWKNLVLDEEQHHSTTEGSLTSDTSKKPRFKTKQTARKSCYVSDMARERRGREREQAQEQRQETSVGPPDTSMAAGPSKPVNKAPKTTHEKVAKQQATGSRQRVKRQSLSKRAVEELKREREMVIESLKAHAQQEEVYL
ncbi:hypothetical protein H0H87_008482 [Tephrocybe sp. NHM501043]|nr:hypothetical protein H0H87_008482 [Tephrocybe sp. NHM501043]